MAMSEYLAYGRLQVDSNVKFAAQRGPQVGGHLVLTDFRLYDPSELSHMASL